MATAIAAPPRRRAPGGPRHFLTVERQDIVGRRMDYIARTREALMASGAAEQLVGRLGADAITFEIHRALRDSRKALVALLTDLLAEAGCLDGLCDDPLHRHPGHGKGA